MSKRRRKTTRPRYEKSVWHKTRLKMMLDADVNARGIHALAREAARGISYQTVTAVIEGRFKNALVEHAFSRATGVAVNDAFPADEVPYRRSAALRITETTTPAASK